MSFVKYWTPPFRYYPTGVAVLDANGENVADVGGWKHLTDKGSHSLSFEEAERIQDALGDHIAYALNATWPKEVK